jgi:predicted dehydrogenase
MSVLRGVISGFGDVATQAHLPGWRACDGVNLAAIHDPVAVRRHLAINLAKNARIYDDLALMLDGESPDFVDVTSPPAYHAGAARMALEAGAHVLVEKPLCLSLAEFDQLAALARSQSRVLMCAHNWKFAPAYQRADQLIRSGRLGAVRYAAIVRLRREPAGSSPAARLPADNSAAGMLSDRAAAIGVSEPWRLDAGTGGGILIDHGWHVFYLVHWLMGLEPLPLGETSMQPGFTLSACLGYAPGSAVDDLADLLFETRSGLLVSVHLSWRSPVRRTSALFYGKHALLEIETDHVLVTDRSGVVEDLSVADAPDDSYHGAWFAQLAGQFVSAIAEGPSGPLVTRNHAEVRFALAAMAAAQASAHAAGARVQLQ